MSLFVTYLLTIIISQWMLLTCKHNTEVFEHVNFKRCMYITYVPYVNYILVILVTIGMMFSKDIYNVFKKKEEI